MTEQETKEMLESTLGPEIDKMAQEVLQEGSLTLEPMDWYEIDFDKVNTIEDVKVILQSMGMKFNRLVPTFDKLKEYSKKVD